MVHVLAMHLSRKVSVLRSHVTHGSHARYPLSRFFLTREWFEYSDTHNPLQAFAGMRITIHRSQDFESRLFSRFVSKFFRVPILQTGLQFVRWYRVPVIFSRGVRRARSVAYSRSGAPTTTVGGSTIVVADRAPARLGRPQVGVQRYRGYVRAVGSRGGAPTETRHPWLHLPPDGPHR